MTWQVQQLPLHCGSIVVKKLLQQQAHKAPQPIPSKNEGGLYSGKIDQIPAQRLDASPRQPAQSCKDSHAPQTTHQHTAAIMFGLQLQRALEDGMALGCLSLLSLLPAGCTAFYVRGDALSIFSYVGNQLLMLLLLLVLHVLNII
jgi:hypothetical protein